jgi:hypothetical protein
MNTAKANKSGKDKQNGKKELRKAQEEQEKLKINTLLKINSP